MISGMRKSYCPQGVKLDKTMGFTDGSSMKVCAKAASVFYATMNKKGWSYGKARPKKVTQTVYEEAVQEIADEMAIMEWWESKQKKQKVEETVPLDEYVKWLLYERE